MAEELVVDASVLLAVFLRESGSGEIISVLEKSSLYAPALVRYETANGLLIASRRGRIDSLERLGLIDKYPLKHPARNHWWRRAEKLVKNTDLTFYDASYAALARVLDLPLYTLDKQLKKVSRNQNISIFTAN
ncbi:MAG: type II toxin-antitoxin system VapC family toxin [bacterium]